MPKPMLCTLNILSFFLPTLNGKYRDFYFAIEETEESELNQLAETPRSRHMIGAGIESSLSVWNPLIQQNFFIIKK